MKSCTVTLTRNRTTENLSPLTDHSQIASGGEDMPASESDQDSEKTLSITKSEKRYFRLKRARELLVDRTPVMLGKYPMRAYM